MAFRASRKSKVPAAQADTTKSTEETAESDVATTPMSVEDLVGGPISAVQNEPAPREEEPVAASPSAPQEESRGQNSSTDQAPYISRQSAPPMDGNGGPRARMGYGRGRFDRGGDRGGRDDRGYGYNRGGYGQNRRIGGGFRRDWGHPPASPRVGEAALPANGYTQDIDVPTETVKGVLDVMPEGHGFLRPKFTPSDRDVYISQSQIRRFLLRNGDMVQGQARQPKDNERYWGLLKVETVNEVEAEQIGQRPKFEDLTPVYPNKQLKLETEQKPLSTRIIDLVAPIGFGQRGLIVSPPKAGKTTILKELAAGISANYPNAHLMAALIGERPEEVTDLSRSIKGEVLASNFDQSPQEQVRVAEVALDRAKRLVELGKDVIVLLDSITRLARAYNMVVNPSGRTLSGGFDPAALYPAKKFLGAARCVELAEGATHKGSYTGGGSMTVIGTALVDTGSRMDDLIYEEFKGTGNMELHLSRSLQERRIFPAIDAGKSGTRHDELLLGEEAMKRIVTLRHMLSLLGDEERTMMLIERLGKTKSNEEFLQSLGQGA